MEKRWKINEVGSCRLVLRDRLEQPANHIFDRDAFTLSGEIQDETMTQRRQCRAIQIRLRHVVTAVEQRQQRGDNMAAVPLAHGRITGASSCPACTRAQEVTIDKYDAMMAELEAFGKAADA